MLAERGMKCQFKMLQICLLQGVLRGNFAYLVKKTSLGFTIYMTVIQHSTCLVLSKQGNYVLTTANKGFFLHLRLHRFNSSHLRNS